MTEALLLRRIRIWLGLFIVGLVLSGVTAFPLVWETRVLNSLFGPATSIGQALPELAAWIQRVASALAEIDARHPFAAYGTDWLAFAHIVLAIAFVGPWRDPVRNSWVLDFGLIACALVIPLALVCGAIRGIPFFWRMLDCSFGVFGAIPLLAARRLTRRISALRSLGGATGGR
jgi:hypothetical protein